eukprot:jgi/Chrzof1/7697/Cz02g33100.t1
MRIFVAVGVVFDWLRHWCRLYFTKPPAADAAQPDAAQAMLHSSPVYYALNQLRSKLAQVHSVLPHSVLSSGQLEAVAAQCPNTMQQLAELIGHQKTEMYGAQVLAAIANGAQSTAQSTVGDVKPQPAQTVRTALKSNAAAGETNLQQSPVSRRRADSQRQPRVDQPEADANIVGDGQDDQAEDSDFAAAAGKKRKRAMQRSGDARGSQR